MVLCAMIGCYISHYFTKETIAYIMLTNTECSVGARSNNMAMLFSVEKSHLNI
jgi:hypothetical protein